MLASNRDKLYYQGFLFLDWHKASAAGRVYLNLLLAKRAQSFYTNTPTTPVARISDNLSALQPYMSELRFPPPPVAGGPPWPAVGVSLSSQTHQAIGNTFGNFTLSDRSRLHAGNYIVNRMSLTKNIILQPHPAPTDSTRRKHICFASGEDAEHRATRAHWSHCINCRPLCPDRILTLSSRSGTWRANRATAGIYSPLARVERVQRHVVEPARKPWQPRSCAIAQL